MTFSPPRKSKSKQMADAVARYCTDQFGMPFRSAMAWSLDQKSLKDRDLVVWPNDRDVEFLNRAASSADYSIAIAVVERIKDSTRDEDITADELTALVESIGDNLIGVSFEGGVCVGYTHQPLYDRELLEEKGIFGGGIALRITRHENLTHL
jgi:hypothetical protein